MEKEKLVSLVTAAQKGDSIALNELFNSFYNDVYYFALKTVKDDELASDVTQEAFIEIINTIGNLKEPAAFVTWMKQITYHQCTRYFKKKKDVLVDEDEDGNTVFDTLVEENAEFIPDEALEKSDFKKTILAMLDELSEEQRAATMMYYFDEMSVKQIAEIQGVSEGTVKSRLNYARKSIKASVEDYEKKNNVKLHAIPLFPLFKWLLQDGMASCIPSVSVVEGVSAATGVTVTASSAATGTAATVTAGAAATAGTSAAAGATATSAATATAVGIGAKIAALPLVTKIVAGVVATAIVAGGTAATVGGITGNSMFGGDVPVGTTSNSSQNVSSIGDSSRPEESEEIVLEGIIPEGCVYICADGTRLEAGKPFPEKSMAGDVVQYGDYSYGYECIRVVDQQHKDKLATWVLWKDIFDSGDSGLEEEDIFEGWTPVSENKTAEKIGTIVSWINGKPIKNLFMTFDGCLNLKTAPAIPKTVTSISMAFAYCMRLETAPLIPQNVKRMMMAFYNCPKLKGDIYIDAELDTTLEYYYTDVFTVSPEYTTLGDYNAELINLVGTASKNTLIPVAENSENKHILVLGSRVQFADDMFGDLDKISNAEEALTRYGGHINAFNMSYFDEPSKIPIDEAVRFSFGEWAGYDVDGKLVIVNEATRLKLLLNRLFGIDMDPTKVTGKYATYRNNGEYVDYVGGAVIVDATKRDEEIYHSTEFSQSYQNSDGSYSIRMYRYKKSTKAEAEKYSGKEAIMVRTDEQSGEYFVLHDCTVLTVVKNGRFWNLVSFIETSPVASDFEESAGNSSEEQEMQEQMLNSLANFVNEATLGMGFSNLPYFTDASTLDAASVFWFDIRTRDLNAYLLSVTGGYRNHQIPVTHIDDSARYYFGTTYDFTALNNTKDPQLGIYNATYVPAEGEDYIDLKVEDGAGGPTMQVKATDQVQLDSTTYQVNLEKGDPTDSTVPVVKQKMIVEYVNENWVIKSYQPA